jgi:hypothetical protein
MRDQATLAATLTVLVLVALAMLIVVGACVREQCCLTRRQETYPLIAA